MDPSRWKQIEDLYHAALECEPGERAVILAQTDPELRGEVESLLAQDLSKSGALDRPAWVGVTGFNAPDSTGTLITPGTQLGPYKIEGSLATGGMGQVFRGVDTRLGRPVAVKTLREQFSARFEREARAISSLNHAHICTLYDVGPNYLVMELCEGETLAARLKRGKLPIQETIRYGAQIADALSAAHAKGIVHRDLKPGNVMLTKAGVKVLDFGLAKSTQDEILTASHVVMGTPAYMAPEQREGKECDARTDIYAMGLMLAEMATGRHGSTEELAGPFAHVVERCLAQHPDDRWQAARDVKFELEWASTAAKIMPATASSRPVFWLIAGAAALLLVAALAFVMLRQPRPLEIRQTRLTINAPPGAELQDGLAISPDARSVVFVAQTAGQSQLWLRPLDSITPRQLPGTEGASFPFWSPDSRSIGYFSAGKLRRIDISSLVSTVICDIGQGRGGTWNEDGAILFNSVNDGPLLRVSASGGMPVAITTVDKARSENSHRFPYFLPGGHKFLYYIRGTKSEDVSGVYLGSLDHAQQKTRLFYSPAAAIFVPAGRGPAHLLWVENGALMARPFNAQRGVFTGEPSPLAERVRINFPAGRYAEISAARDGTVVYGPERTALRQLTWYGRNGKASGTIGPSDSYRGLRFSPDGKRAAVNRAASPSHSAGIAVLDMARGIATPLIGAFWGAWSPDGERVAYTGGGLLGSPKVQVMPISGDRKGEQLTHSEGSETVLDWSGDGRYILYSERSNNVAAAGQSGLWVLRLADRKPMLVAQVPPQHPTAQFSPDSHWIAYASRESGRLEVYVQGFSSGRKWQVSDNGGDHPRWRKDGNEMFYLAPDETLMSVSVRHNGDSLEFTSPTALFKISLPVAITGTPGEDTAYPYDVSLDGQRVLAMAPAGESEAQTLVVLSNWQAGPQGAVR
jgi:Tol biopolymer transport system component